MTGSFIAQGKESASRTIGWRGREGPEIPGDGHGGIARVRHGLYSEVDGRADNWDPTWRWQAVVYARPGGLVDGPMGSGRVSAVEFGNGPRAHGDKRTVG